MVCVATMASVATNWSILMCQTDSLSKALISSLYHIICVLFAIQVQGSVTEVECTKRAERSGPKV